MGAPCPRRILVGLCCGVALVSSSIASGGVWTTHGPDDGRVNAIAVNPSIPTTVYAGTDGGGFFKSLDAGDTWSAAERTLPDAFSRNLKVTVAPLSLNPTVISIR
jgi:hypothetical protein